MFEKFDYIKRITEMLFAETSSFIIDTRNSCELGSREGQLKNISKEITYDCKNFHSLKTFKLSNHFLRCFQGLYSTFSLTCQVFFNFIILSAFSLVHINLH